MSNNKYKMSKIKCQMPKVNKVKLLSERTSGAPPVIFKNHSVEIVIKRMHQKCVAIQLATKHLYPFIKLQIQYKMYNNIHTLIKSQLLHNDYVQPIGVLFLYPTSHSDLDL